MFFTASHGVMDFDLDMLVELLGLVDRQIAMIEKEISRCADPDGFGHLDRLEGIIGLGFVACQQYINATYPQLAIQDETRKQVIASPPNHSCGRSFAVLIDAAANYWKHHVEWPAAENKGFEGKTREVLELLGPSTADFVVSNTLYSLAGRPQPRFASILRELTLWRDLRIKRTCATMES